MLNRKRALLIFAWIASVAIAIVATYRIGAAKPPSQKQIFRSKTFENVIVQNSKLKQKNLILQADLLTLREEIKRAEQATETPGLRSSKK